MNIRVSSEIGAVLRSDFPAFIEKVFRTIEPGAEYYPNWHIEAIAHQLLRCQRGESKRLMINQPPRSLKSVCASIAFPAWMIGHDPSAQILCVSYGSELASDLHRKFRLVAESSWYQQIFPNVKWIRETDTEFTTTKGGRRIASSVGGTLTGRGADLIIIDDPL